MIRFSTPPSTKERPLTNTMLIVDSTKSMNVDPNWVLQAFTHVNNIIRAYQIVTKDVFNHGIINQLTWNQFGCVNTIGEIDENGKFKKSPEVFYFVLGIAAESIPDTEYYEIKHLAESTALMQTRALDEILIQAKIFLEQHNFRMTVLESVIALEFALSSIVRNSAKRKGMTEGKIEAFIFKLGTAQILDSLKLLITEKLPSEEIISACRKANSVRNNIVHRGCLAVTLQEAQEALRNVELFIQHFGPSLCKL